MLDATPLLRLYAGWRQRQLAREDPAATQERQLLRLVRRARDTRFGREHGFAAIGSVADFQRRVPVRRYEDFWTGYWQPAYPRLVDVTWPGLIPYFALTSGTTTGRTKYIPVSREMVASNRGAALDVLVHHFAKRHKSRVLGGKSFMLGGSTDLEEPAPGIRSGDLSGIAAIEVPFWARPYTFPPPDLALLADWEVKVDRLARQSLEEDIRSIGGTVSWLLLFLDRLAELRGDGDPRVVRAYPDLELVVHGGVGFAPYRDTFAALLDGSHAELREVYPASEGFLAVADRGPGEGLRLILDRGLFFEFVPFEEVQAANPTRHWAATVEPGVIYAVALSSCAGVWSFLLGDTVTFVDRRPPRLLVTGRTSYFLSAFGEHLMGEEIDRAVAEAAHAIGAAVTDYAVGPIYPASPGERGRHLYLVEFHGAMPEPDRLAAFAAALDRRLLEGNPDYEAHRSGGFGMAAPEVRALPPGSFAAWMRSRGKLGGQNKVPRVITDPELFGSLRTFTEVGRRNA